MAMDRIPEQGHMGVHSEHANHRCRIGVSTLRRMWSCSYLGQADRWPCEVKEGGSRAQEGTWGMAECGDRDGVRERKRERGAESTILENRKVCHLLLM